MDARAGESMYRYEKVSLICVLYVMVCLFILIPFVIRFMLNKMEICFFADLLT